MAENNEQPPKSNVEPSKSKSKMMTCREDNAPADADVETDQKDASNVGKSKEGSNAQKPSKRKKSKVAADEDGEVACEEDFVRTILMNPDEAAKKATTQHLFDEKRETMIQELEKEDWFHGTLPIEDVAMCLKATGDFLIYLQEQDDKDKQLISGAFQAFLAVRSKDPTSFVKFPIYLLNRGHVVQYTIDGKNTKDTVIEIVKFHMAGEPVGDGIKLAHGIAKQPWELPPNRITKEKKLGEGQFGEVWKGKLDYNQKKVDVAVKVTKVGAANRAKTEEMFKESRIMRQLKHQNIVAFYGMVIRNDSVTIVMELMTDGSLDIYLRKNPNTPITTRTSYVYDCAFGLFFMHKKGVLHRDIAVRNVLIDLARNIVKLSDFGLSKKADVYMIQNQETVPTRWQAPEVLTQHTYTQASDVYSFAILVWEIFHNAAKPFEGISNAAIRQNICDEKYRPAVTCTQFPPVVKAVMVACWQTKSEARPKMGTVTHMLSKLVAKDKADAEGGGAKGGTALVRKSAESAKPSANATAAAAAGAGGKDDNSDSEKDKITAAAPGGAPAGGPRKASPSNRPRRRGEDSTKRKSREPVNKPAAAAAAAAPGGKSADIKPPKRTDDSAKPKKSAAPPSTKITANKKKVVKR